MSENSIDKISVNGTISDISKINLNNIIYDITNKTISSATLLKNSRTLPGSWISKSDSISVNKNDIILLLVMGTSGRSAEGTTPASGSYSAPNCTKILDYDVNGTNEGTVGARGRLAILKVDQDTTINMTLYVGLAGVSLFLVYKLN